MREQIYDARYERRNQMSPREFAWSTRTLQRADTRRRGRSKEEDREERTGRVHWNASFDREAGIRCKPVSVHIKENRTNPRCASAICTQMATRTHYTNVQYIRVCVYMCGHIRARSVMNKIVQRCKFVGLWEVYTYRVLLS